MSIFKALGVASVPYLPKVLPVLFAVLRGSGDDSLREFILDQLTVLTRVSGCALSRVQAFDSSWPRNHAPARQRHVQCASMPRSSVVVSMAAACSNQLACTGCDQRGAACNGRRCGALLPGVRTSIPAAWPCRLCAPTSGASCPTSCPWSTSAGTTCA